MYSHCYKSHPAFFFKCRDITNWMINNSNTENTVLNELHILMDHITSTALRGPRVRVLGGRGLAADEQYLEVFRSEKALLAVLILSNYLHSSSSTNNNTTVTTTTTNSSSIHGRTASPLFLRGYNLSGVAAVLSTLVWQAYSVPTTIIEAFNTSVSETPGLSHTVLSELCRVTLSTSTASDDTSRRATKGGTTTAVATTSAAITATGEGGRERGGRYFLWDAPPASFAPYVNTLKLSFLSSSSPQYFEAQHTDTSEDRPPPPQQPKERLAATSPATSVLGCICTRVLLILRGFFCDFQTVENLILGGRGGEEGAMTVDSLFNLILTLRKDSGDSGRLLIQLEALSALESLFVTASLSCSLLECLAKMGVVERLTDIVVGPETQEQIRDRAAALLAQLLCTSSRLTNVLVAAFRAHGGYDALHKAFATILAEASRQRQEALLRVLHLLLYVGLDGPGNLDGIRLLVRLYVDSTDSFKSDLLSTLKGAILIQKEHRSNSTDEERSAENADSSDLNSNTNTNESEPIVIEVFKMLDGVPSVEDRLSLLSVVDETLGLQDAGEELVTAYCALLGQDMRPSTVILAANHMTKAVKTGIIPKASLNAVDFLSVLYPYFVSPNELPFKEVKIYTHTHLCYVYMYINALHSLFLT